MISECNYYFTMVDVADAVQVAHVLLVIQVLSSTSYYLNRVVWIKQFDGLPANGEKHIVLTERMRDPFHNSEIGTNTHSMHAHWRGEHLKVKASTKRMKRVTYPINCLLIERVSSLLNVSVAISKPLMIWNWSDPWPSYSLTVGGATPDSAPSPLFLSGPRERFLGVPLYCFRIICLGCLARGSQTFFDFLLIRSSIEVLDASPFSLRMWQLFKMCHNHNN